jgi:hypothetical protein
MWLLYGAGDCTAVPIEHGKQNSCRLIFGTQLKLVRPFTFCITLIFTNVAKIRAISLGFPEKKKTRRQVTFVDRAESQVGLQLQ